MKLKFDLIKLLSTLFVIVLIIVILVQGYNYLYKDAETEFAIEISCENTVKTVGYFIRNEKTISAGTSKYIDVILNDGNKVSKNGTIANVYSTEDAAKIQTQIRELQMKKDEFENVISTSAKYNEKNSYASDIKKSSIKLSQSVSKGEFNLAFENASEFLTDVIKDKIACGEITDYSEKLKLLDSEMNALKSRSSSVTSYIKSSESGYFSQSVDGREDVINMKMTENFDRNAYEQIKNACESDVTPPARAIGKVVAGSEWQVCFSVKTSDLDNFKVGSIMKIRIPSVTDSIIKCTVLNIVTEGEYSYVVLQSNTVTDDLISQRVCELDIIIDSYEGLRVDKNALRKIDGENGVFVKSNGILKYRKVNILYIGSTFAVIEYNPLSKTSVQVYDEVVVKGTDLYDEKVIS